MKNSLIIWRNQKTQSLLDKEDDFDEMWSRAWSQKELPLESQERSFFKPKVDVTEDETAYMLSFDLPGLKNEDIRIDLYGDTLTISGERQLRTMGPNVGVFRLERNYGKFSRSFTLPANSDTQNINADYQDGVLELRIPKSKAANRSIPVRQK
ncbi:MAG: Hsp20/alpha crystallin family protein [Pseudobdellovibrionaceae bacterium]